IRDISVSLADILAFVAVVWLSFGLSRWLRALLEDEFLPRFRMPRGVPNTISRLTHYAVLLIGFLFAVNLAGLDLNRFTLLVGAFGVGIGFGLQNVVNNFISGLILLFERPVQVSDRVQVGSMLGFIEHIGIRASVIRTFEGAEVIVPNGQLISDVVTNWTLSDRMRRIDIEVGVAYGTDPDLVLGVLRRVADEHPDVLAEPEPYVLFMAFGESSLDFSLRAWTADYEQFLRIGSELRVGIARALKDAGIEIPFPQRDLHLRTVPPREDGSTPEDSGPIPPGRR
ncbi:mechanosensitive ion channel, partial [bacterium]|nr:mechanosensitive ion channel [bacterium]